jgi:hypothetical protein
VSAPPSAGGAAHLKLVGARCAACGHTSWPLTTRCPACGDGAAQSLTLSGAATLLARTTVMPPDAEPSAGDASARRLALVQLAEGPRLLCPLSDADEIEFRPGLPVYVTLRRGDDLGAGRCYILKAVPSFLPDPPA